MPRASDPTVPPPWEAQVLPFFFWGSFSLWICGIFAVPLHPQHWGLDTMPRGLETKPISSNFQSFPVGLGRGNGNGSFSRLCPASLEEVPREGWQLTVSPTASSGDINPGKPVGPSLCVVPREGLEAAEGSLTPQRGKCCLLALIKLQKKYRNNAKIHNNAKIMLMLKYRNKNTIQ